uniref:S-locus cysteine-rich protein n=1 Tax=Brassica oleracea TaxID=3712 RepID=Q9SE19_BRAOL|nr:S-locus cysteine-rich protein [Brassica oleracea]
MKSAIYALLCFIFLVSSHGQEVEANLKKNCVGKTRLPGPCGDSGASSCRDLYNQTEKTMPVSCRCVPTGRCFCSLCK